MKIEFFQNNKCYQRDNLSIKQINNFYKQVINSSDIIDYNKIWIYDDSNNLYAVINLKLKSMNLVSNMNFGGKNLNLVRRKLPNIYIINLFVYLGVILCI